MPANPNMAPSIEPTSAPTLRLFDELGCAVAWPNIGEEDKKADDSKLDVTGGRPLDIGICVERVLDDFEVVESIGIEVEYGESFTEYRPIFVVTSRVSGESVGKQA
jgi:hypothetical protein